MKKIIIIISFLLGSSTFLVAQTPKDYILSMQKDTLFGTIKNSLDWESITFIHNKRKVPFHASTLKDFGIYRNGNYRRYKSIKDIEGIDIFVEILSEGKIKLYKPAEQYNRFSRFIYLNQVYYVGSSDNNLVLMSREDYFNFINFIINENPHLEEELKQLSFEALPKLVAMYNQL